MVGADAPAKDGRNPEIPGTRRADAESSRPQPRPGPDRGQNLRGAAALRTGCRQARVHFRFFRHGGGRIRPGKRVIIPMMTWR